jgi:serine/threonine protein kinase
MAGRPPDVDLEVAEVAEVADGGQPALRDGRETLLPSIARSALSTRPAAAQVKLDPSGFQDVSETPSPPPAEDRPRGARTGTKPKIREMFYREARLASALTHDNICSIVDFGQDDAFGLFMVMELRSTSG